MNIDAAEQLIDRIKPLAKATHRAGVDSNIGGFGALFDLKKAGFKDPILCSATDGVGTKLRLAIDHKTHHTIGIDLVAMSVNDLLVQNAEPLFFLDYFACGKLNLETATEIINSISDGCKIANCALIGGETAEMPDMYHGEDYDLAGFAVGAVERRKKLSARLPNNQGFTAIGLPSSGLHSNGYSLVRKIIERAQPNLNDAPPFDDGDNNRAFIDLLLTPTKIYTNAVQALSNADLLSGACHITGGGFYENLPRGLPDNAKLAVDSSAIAEQKIFSWLKQAGNVPTREMYRHFQYGYRHGFIHRKSKCGNRYSATSRRSSRDIR